MIFISKTTFIMYVFRTGNYNNINGTATLVDPAYAELAVNFDSVPGANKRLLKFDSNFLKF